MTIPFDVEKSATADVAKLLLAGVNHVTRIPTTDARQVVPIAFKVIPPPGLPADLTIAATLPAGVTVAFAQPALTSSNATTATWNVKTDGTEFVLHLWVRLPDAIGNYTVIGTGAFGGQAPIVTKTVTLVVAADRAAIESAVASDLAALASSAPAKDQKAITDATNALNAAKAVSGSDAASAATAIDKVLTLIDALGTVSVDTAAARRNADRLLLWWQSRGV